MICSTHWFQWMFGVIAFKYLFVCLFYVFGFLIMANTIAQLTSARNLSEQYSFLCLYAVLVKLRLACNFKMNWKPKKKPISIMSHHTNYRSLITFLFLKYMRTSPCWIWHMLNIYANLSVKLLSLLSFCHFSLVVCTNRSILGSVSRFSLTNTLSLFSYRQWCQGRLMLQLRGLALILTGPPPEAQIPGQRIRPFNVDPPVPSEDSR